MYINSGKQVLYRNAEGERIHIADAKDNEAAHAITVTMNERSDKFIRQAIVTKSPDFHGDKVSKAQFTGRLNGAIDAMKKLDAVKKTLFYGRDNNLISEGQKGVADLPARFGGNDNAIVEPIAVDIIHAILGIATEAGELLELLKATINGDRFDWVNCQEELGDIAWYQALLAEHGDFTFEEFQQRIIKKLRGRYADKFSAAEAIDRDLAAERAILEDNANPMRDEGDALNIVPSIPASGRPAVEQVAGEAATAFDRLQSKGGDMVDSPATGTQSGNVGNELHKSVAARRAPLAHEKLAHQPIRREDLDKS